MSTTHFFVCGRNINGALGIGDENVNEAHIPLPLTLNFKVKQIACGSSHIMLLSDNNELYGCGYNNQRNLGLESMYDFYEFQKIDTWDKTKIIKNIYCTSRASIILTNDNEIYSCGDYYEIGREEEKGFRYFFQRVPLENYLENCEMKKLIVTSTNLFIVTNNNNSLYYCGNTTCVYECDLKWLPGEDTNVFKKLNISPITTPIKFIVTGSLESWIVTENNELYQFYTEYNPEQTQYEEEYYNYSSEEENDSCDSQQTDYGEYFSPYNREEWNYGEIKQIICNNGYVVIVTINNDIYVKGSNSRGGLGFCKEINKIDNFTKLINLPFPNYDLYEIVSNGKANFFVTKNNGIFVSGVNSCGELSQELGIIYEIKPILYLDKDIVNYVSAGNEFAYFYFKELNNEGDELLARNRFFLRLFNCLQSSENSLKDISICLKS